MRYSSIFASTVTVHKCDLLKKITEITVASKYTCVYALWLKTKLELKQ